MTRTAPTATGPIRSDLTWIPVPDDIPPEYRSAYADGWRKGHDDGYRLERPDMAGLGPMGRFGYLAGHDDGVFTRMGDDHEKGLY